MIFSFICNSTMFILLAPFILSLGMLRLSQTPFSPFMLRLCSVLDERMQELRLKLKDYIIVKRKNTLPPPLSAQHTSFFYCHRWPPFRIKQQLIKKKIQFVEIQHP